MKAEPMDDNWNLNEQQFAFMNARLHEIEEAYEGDDNAFFDSVTQSEEWKALFGKMSWDEAYDRYEESLGE